MELYKKVSILSALLLAAASTTSAFVPRTNTGRVGGLCMSAVAEEATAKKEGTVISGIRLVFFSNFHQNIITKIMFVVRLSAARIFFCSN